MEWFEFVLLGFATQRLVAFWFGTPFFAKLRDTLVRRGGLLGQGANCGLCVSTWAGLLVYVVWLVVPYSVYPLTALAVGSLAMLLNAWAKGQ